MLNDDVGLHDNYKYYRRDIRKPFEEHFLNKGLMSNIELDKLVRVRRTNKGLYLDMPEDDVHIEPNSKLVKLRARDI